MNSKKKKTFLSQLPAYVWAIITAFAAIILLFFLAYGLGAIAFISEDAGEFAGYIFYDLFIAVACFLICKQYPKSLWYVLVISNIMGIISAIVEPNFWISGLWILFCSGWVLSFTTGVWGAVIGKKRLAKNVV